MYMYASKDIAQNKTDRELVALTLKDNSWYQYLMKRYERKLARYIKRICPMNKEDTEDVLEEVFIKVYRYLNDFNTDLSFSSWIYRIAHNEALSYLRKLDTQPKTVYSDPDSPVFGSLSQDIDFQQKINEKYFEKNITKAFDNLDEKYRSVLILKYLENKDYREISDILKKPMGTIATLINRGKKQLKAKVIKNKLY